MLKEIVYWTYRFFYKLRRAQKRKDNNGKMDSVMVVSVCLFANVLTLVNFLNYFMSIDVLAYIPVTTRYELISWICIIIIMAPFIAFVYKRYFAKEKFSNMIQEYAAKSKRRRIWGSLWAFCYFILTWAAFLKSVLLVN